jgi:exodeoxyribonuclease-3
LSRYTPSHTRVAAYAAEQINTTLGLASFGFTAPNATSMRLIIVSLNVGKLSAKSRASGFFRWALENNADVICIQSTGVHDAGYPQYANLAGFRRFSDHHQTNGTTGVAIYTRANAGREDINICDHEQCRGRHIEVRLPSGLIIGSTYIRSGADWARQEWKQNLRCVAERMRVCADEPMIVTGDFNLAIEPIDLWPENPKSQYGFMVPERELFQELERVDGWIDSFRHMHPTTRSYTRWPNEESFPRKGWRLDYQWVSRCLAPALIRAEIAEPPTWEQRFSDHAPMLTEYSFDG